MTVSIARTVGRRNGVTVSVKLPGPLFCTVQGAVTGGIAIIKIIIGQGHRIAAGRGMIQAPVHVNVLVVLETVWE